MFAGWPATGRLMLHPDARIIASSDTLHVVQAYSSLTLRGTGLEELHARLSPLLDGRFTLGQVLASAGANATTLERYLSTLVDGGVLLPGPPPTLPSGFPERRPGIQELVSGSVSIAVTLAGPESERGEALRLSFASRSEIERRLVRLAGHSDAARIWVVCDRAPGDEELSRRGLVARHLLARDLSRRDGARLEVFHLAADELVLRRLAAAHSRSTPLDSLPLQLDLVRLLDRPQLPFAAMVAELPGLGRRQIGYGLDSRQVRDLLTARFLGREALLEANAAEPIAGMLGYLGEVPMRGTPVTLSSKERVHAVVASSRLSCMEQLLCAWASRRRVIRRSVDLLCVEPPSPRVAVLQDMLRRRGASLKGELDERLRPLTTFRSGTMAVTRLGREETIAEALLRAVADAVGLSQSAGFACVPSLRCHATVRRRLRAALSKLPGRLRVVIGSYRRLGFTFHFGVPRGGGGE